MPIPNDAPSISVGGSGGPRLAAILTNAINLEGVAGGGVVVSASDFLLQLVHFMGKEFHRTAAFGADHMVMAAPVVLVLVAGNAIVESDFAGQSALGEQFESAVDGGIADAGVLFLDEAVQFVGGKMVAGFEEGAQDGIALGGLLQADTLEVAVEDVLCFAHHLARDGGLVIDTFLEHALLQHEGSG